MIKTLSNENTHAQTLSTATDGLAQIMMKNLRNDGGTLRRRQPDSRSGAANARWFAKQQNGACCARVNPDAVKSGGSHVIEKIKPEEP